MSETSDLLSDDFVSRVSHLVMIGTTFASKERILAGRQGTPPPRPGPLDFERRCQIARNRRFGP
jgi:hypothetical protein